MQFTVAASFDAATHIAESATVGDGIRIATVAMTAADVERDDVASAAATDPAYAKNGQRSAWAKAFPDAFNPPVAPDPSQPYGGWGDMGWFSAACWFHGLELYARSSREVPVGLITAAWGGQTIEPFSRKRRWRTRRAGNGASGVGVGVGVGVGGGAGRDVVDRSTRRSRLRPRFPLFGPACMERDDRAAR